MEAQWMTLKQFAEKNPAFPVSSLQWMRQRATREIVRTGRDGQREVLRRLPHFDGCFGKVGKKLLVNAPKLNAVLAASAAPGGMPAPAAPPPAPAPALPRRRAQRAA